MDLKLFTLHNEPGVTKEMHSRFTITTQGFYYIDSQWVFVRQNPFSIKIQPRVENQNIGGGATEYVVELHSYAIAEDGTRTITGLTILDGRRKQVGPVGPKIASTGAAFFRYIKLCRLSRFSYSYANKAQVIEIRISTKGKRGMERIGVFKSNQINVTKLSLANILPTASARRNMICWDFDWDGTQTIQQMVDAGPEEQLSRRGSSNEDEAATVIGGIHGSDSSLNSNSSSAMSYQNTEPISDNRSSKKRPSTSKRLLSPGSEAFPTTMDTLRSSSRFSLKNLTFGKSSSDPTIITGHEIKRSRLEEIARESSLSSDDQHSYLSSKQNLEFESFFSSIVDRNGESFPTIPQATSASNLKMLRLESHDVNLYNDKMIFVGKSDSPPVDIFLPCTADSDSIFSTGTKQS